jgi:CheY-like chemotaxis protein
MKTYKKILIAEDELLIAKVLRMQFEKLGCQVENVSGSDEVVKKTREMLPDIIILDVCLRNKTSGIEAGKRIRQEGFDTAIVFTTGNAYSNTLEEVKEIKRTAVLSKPIEFEYLLRTIKGVWEQNFSADTQ